MTTVERIVSRGFDRTKVEGLILTAHVFMKKYYNVKYRNFKGALRLEGDYVVGTLENKVKDKATGEMTTSYKATVQEHLDMLIEYSYGETGRTKILSKVDEQSTQFKNWKLIRNKLREYGECVEDLTEFDMNLVA